jgi:hypothetical protein
MFPKHVFWHCTRRAESRGPVVHAGAAYTYGRARTARLDVPGRRVLNMTTVRLLLNESAPALNA